MENKGISEEELPQYVGKNIAVTTTRHGDPHYRGVLEGYTSAHLVLNPGYNTGAFLRLSKRLHTMEQIDESHHEGLSPGYHKLVGKGPDEIKRALGKRIELPLGAIVNIEFNGNGPNV